MFEKFTDIARKVMILANQEAQRCNHEYVDTGHMLIALLKVKEERGLGATVLQNLGADLLEMRSILEEIDKPGRDMVTPGNLPQTPQAKKAIEYSLEEARRLNHNYVSTEHILLGLLHQPEKDKLSTANKILRKLKIKSKEVREEVMNLLGAKEKTASGRKEERPIKCKIFSASVSEIGVRKIEQKITKFLADGKEFIQAVLLPTGFIAIAVFYQDKIKGA